MAKDISAVGAKIVFSGGSLKGLTISEFSDEGTPFECSDVDVSTNAKNLNGEMISSRTPSVYPFSVTVIPNSLADRKLAAALKKATITIGNKDQSNSIELYTCTITMPNVFNTYTSGNNDASATSAATKVTFSNCRIKSGPTGPSTSAEGRMSARTYTFEAENFDPS